MNAFRIVRYCSLVGVLVLLLIGCGGAGSGSPATDFTSSPPADGTGIPTASNPRVEPSGPESPQPSRKRGPSIPTASLPIGGGPVEPDDRSPTCASVSLLVNDDNLPQGVSVSVTAVRIEGRAFARSSSGCEGGSDPRCAEGSFAFTDDQRNCDVPVIPTGKPGERAFLVLDGKAHCPAGSSDFCAGFAKAAKKQQRAIELIVPRPSDSPPPPDGTIDPPPTDSGSPSPTG